jgi:16S rRNA (uracil1498-N3)-methyltransferase
MNLFYHDDVEFSKLSVNEEFELPYEEAQHAIKVMRLNFGDEIWVTDGRGFRVKALIIEINKKRLIAQIKEKLFTEKPEFKIVLAVAPTKNSSRFEWFLEKATEMGIDEIFPIICDHSERRNLNIERTKKVISSAVKQSLRNYHPTLHRLGTFDEILKLDFDGQKFLAHYENENQKSLKQEYNKNENVLIIIGPEGDFSRDEISKSQKQNIKTIILGNTRLRTETAALVACFTINLINE